MKTVMELQAVQYQLQARLRHAASRCRILDGATRYAKEDQEEAAYLYRQARAYMGVTRGDVKKAEQPESPPC